MSKHPITAPRLAGLALAALSVAVSGALVSPVASASGFQISENTAQALGRAYAGREAAGNDASVVLNNPAAMVDFALPSERGGCAGCWASAAGSPHCVTKPSCTRMIARSSQ